MQLSLKGIFQPPTLLNFLIDSKQLAKPGLSLSVVFSSLASYLLGVDHFDLLQFSLLGIGGFLVVGASNVFNQIIERDTDALMTRTQQRPLPEKRMQVATAYFVGFTLGVSGLFLLYAIAPFCAYLGFIAMLLYALVYTPLKKITPLAVFVGAIPGAIPFMLGWFAATKSFGIECFFLFLVQFFWL
jgi:protoheme IX farnesyltransferase